MTYEFWLLLSNKAIFIANIIDGEREVTCAVADLDTAAPIGRRLCGRRKSGSALLARRGLPANRDFGTSGR
jgi:hypothetical protein